MNYIRSFCGLFLAISSISPDGMNFRREAKLAVAQEEINFSSSH